MKFKTVWLISYLVLVLFAGCQAVSENPYPRPAGQKRLVDFGHGICLDTFNGLMWQAEESGALVGWQQARQYAEELELAGFDDWRLPTHDELYIMYKILDRKDSGNCQIKLKDSFWTGNSEKTARVGFWDSEPLCGGPSYFFIKRAAGAALAVRMSQVPR